MKKSFIVLIAAVALVSCNAKKARDYSDSIVNKEQALTPDIQKTETAVAEFSKTDNYDSVVAVSSRMESEVDNALKEITSAPAPDVKLGEEFKKASITYFAYIKSIYTSYVNFGAAKTPEDRSAAVAKMQDVASSKEKVLGDMQDMQRKYADANGVKMEKKY